MVYCSLKVYICIKYQNGNRDPLLSILNLDPIHPTGTAYMDLQYFLYTSQGF